MSDFTDKMIAAANTAVANHDFTDCDFDPDSVDDACTRVAVAAAFRVLADHLGPMTGNVAERAAFVTVSMLITVMANEIEDSP
jgi:hypothetical protein